MQETVLLLDLTQQLGLALRLETLGLGAQGFFSVFTQLLHGSLHLVELALECLLLQLGCIDFLLGRLQFLIFFICLTRQLFEVALVLLEHALYLLELFFVHLL